MPWCCSDYMTRGEVAPMVREAERLADWSNGCPRSPSSA